MGPASEKQRQTFASNRKALRDYSVLERLEAGIELQGTEVKSVRAGNVSMAGAFARVDNGEVFLQGLTIQPYEYGNRFNHDPLRSRRLLLHHKEIAHIAAQTEQKGFALVPLRVYMKRGHVKIELGVCRGKTHGDRRETIRRRTADREAARAMRREST